MQYNSGAYGRGNPRLPAGWRQLYDTNSNRNYYVNDVTGTTQWEPPQAAPVAPQPLPGCQVVQVNLPPGVPPGGLIQIQVGGGTYQIEAPAGISPGQPFFAQVPLPQPAPAPAPAPQPARTPARRSAPQREQLSEIDTELEALKQQLMLQDGAFSAGHPLYDPVVFCTGVLTGGDRFCSAPP